MLGYRKSKFRFQVMKYFGFIYFTSCWLMFGIKVASCDGTTSWRSGPPDGLPELVKLNVECGKEEMTIRLEFSAPYDGTIYSKTNGQSERCIHVAPHSRISETTFTIEYDACGTRSDPQGKFYENTIVIQYDDIVIEAWDEAKKIRCEWHDGYEKSAFKMPITISDLDVVEMNFQGDDVDCWLEVQDGKGPWSAKVEGLVPLGSPLTLVVAIQDSEGHFDMRVKSCIAHDGHKHPIHLTDEDGCVLRPKMMTPFQKTTETKGTASVIAYSHFYAFKFPETVEVTIQCTVEICRHGCPGTCMEGRDSDTSNQDTNYQQSPPKEEDVPTYKDSFPFSTIITSRPGFMNQSANLNTSSSMIITGHSNASKEDNADPLETSPNTNHDFVFDRYPYDLFDLMAEDRVDDKIEYMVDDRNQDKDYTENADDVYYSQLPNIFGSLNENGKNFPSAQRIHSVPNKTAEDAESSVTTAESLPSTESYTLTTPPFIPEDETLAPKKGMHTSTTESELNITEIPMQIDVDQKSDQEVEVDPEPESRDSGQQQPKSMPLHSKDTANDSIPFGRPDRSGEIFSDSNEYNEASVDKADYELTSNRRLSGEDAVVKKQPEANYEEQKLRARKPIDTYEMRQNQFQYQHFRPLSPQPPLTLFNGVPLFYYNQPNTNIEFIDRDGPPYLSRYHYQKDYVKSKLRRPGRRRGRRDIGEKEQLGLKQTLRVIAATDLDFFAKDSDNVRPNYAGKVDANLDVCMAPSSLAAGLGLLILANICVLCVVVFLGHHYYIHRKVKVKTVELLCTELS